MSKLGLTPEEETKLKTICEYLFFDQYKEHVTYNRFEQCFQPLFNNIKISIYEVFKNIVGPKRKYLNYSRFVNSYLLWKVNDPSINQDLSTFFTKLFNFILKKENTFIGKPQEKTFNFCTPKACKRRDCLSGVSILSDKEGSIQGLIMEYDNIVQNKMYPTKIEQNLVISLEMKLGIIDEKIQKDLKNLGGVKEEFCKDAVTHIFGTFNDKTGLISFLGFKCVSGKTVFVGYPQGAGFLYGKFGTKFHEIKMHNNLSGINFFQPGFNTNIKTNVYLNTKANDISKDNLTNEISIDIQDEKELSQIDDKDKDEKEKENVKMIINKMITTPIIEENYFLDEKLLDEIDGNDYKEVVNQVSRDWILKSTEPTKKEEVKSILTVEDALKEVEKEKEKSKEILIEVNKELMAKGFKRGKKSKHRKKNEKKKGKLHETKALFSFKKKKNYNKWDGKNEIGKNLKPMDFLKNRDNYAKLKYHLVKGFYDDISKTSNAFENKFAQNIMNTMIPSPEESLNKRNNKSVRNRRNRKAKGKEVEKEKEVEKKIEKKKEHKLIIKNKKGEIKSFTREELKKRPKSVQKSHPMESKEIPVEISSEISENKYNNYFSSDAEILAKIINKIKSNSDNTDESGVLRGDKKHLKEAKGKNPVEKWKIFGNKMKMFSGPLLLQSIGVVLKAIRAINEEIDGKKVLTNEERLSLFELLDENERILNFLNQEKEETKEGEENEEQDIVQEKEEDLLLPSDHPEEITNLKELENKMDEINKLLAKQDLKDEDRKKIEKLKNLYLQRKNILIENKTEVAKTEIINQNKIDVNKYLEEEKKRREEAQKEAQKRIEEEIKKEQAQEKEVISISKITPPKSTEIFRKQEFYTGKEPWIDPLFKPEIKNICPVDKNGKWVLPPGGIDEDVSDWDNADWCRVKELFDSENYCVFSNGIAIEDIIQGTLGDCYFLSAIGSLCKFSNVLENLFIFKQKTKENLYGIYFYINGIKKLVLLDDFLPYKLVASYKRIIMGHSEENEIWVALIEKAFAKINGSYINMGTGGSPNEVFDVLTEAYSEQITVSRKEADEIWKKLKDGEDKGFIMTAGTSANPNLELVGLYCAHAYSVLGIHEINGERVIRLRNPYGDIEFTGNWSDYSSKWTEELKKKYNHYLNNNDGDFFMGFTDFTKYFVTMGICKFHKSWSSTKLKIKKSIATKCQLIKVTIPEDDTLVYLQLYSKNPRIAYKNGEYPKPVLCNLILADKDFNFIAAMKDNERHIGIEATLKKGEYYLFADSNFRYTSQGPHGYTVTAYSDVDIPLENVTENKNMDVPGLLRKTLIDFCKKNVEPFPQKNGVDYYVTEAFNKNLPYRVLVLDNKTDKTKTVKYEIVSKGNKSASFYCDDMADEKDNIIVKQIKSKEISCTIIMYHTLSSLFEHKLSFVEQEEYKDKDYYHEVFNEEPEPLNDEGTLKDYYISEGDDKYIIGIENNTKQKMKLKLTLEGMKLSRGEFEGKIEAVFELKENSRKIFEAIVTTDDENVSFEFDFA